MKKVINLLKLGLKNPRYYIEAINVPWGYIHLIGFLAAAVMSLFMMFNISPFINQIGEDLNGAIEYIPEYRFQDSELQLADGEKPLYYQAGAFQLVIDDSLELNNSQIALNQNQKNLIKENIPLSLFLIKNDSFVSINSVVQTVPQYDYIFATPHRLSLFLQYFNENKTGIYIVSFISFLISFIIAYWIQMLLIAMFAGFFNTRLTRPILFGSRVKLAVVVSFVPIIIIEIVKLIIPGFRSSYFILAAITLFLIYKAFQNHTNFIHQIMRTLDDNEIEQLKDDQMKDKKKDSKDKKK